jgi:hypothetical protein
MLVREDPMDGGALYVGNVPLIRKVRMTLDAGRSGSDLASRSQAAVRRDIDGLLSRLERLRRKFPGNQDLLARVDLSPHVVRLIDEVREGPDPRGGRSPCGGEARW